MPDAQSTLVEAQKSVTSEVLTEMSDRIKNSLLEATNKAVYESIKKMRIKVEKVVSENVESTERRLKLKTMFEAEFIEPYNKQDNIRSLVVKDD